MDYKNLSNEELIGETKRLHECAMTVGRVWPRESLDILDAALELADRLAQKPTPDFLGDKEPVTNYCPVCEAREGWVSELRELKIGEGNDHGRAYIILADITPKSAPQLFAMLTDSNAPSPPETT